MRTYSSRYIKVGRQYFFITFFYTFYALSLILSQGLLAVFIADLVLQILSFVAETERHHIRVRQRDGIAAAKARGVKFGRPAIELPPCFSEVVRHYHNREISLRAAASLCGMSPASFWRKSRK